MSSVAAKLKATALRRRSKQTWRNILSRGSDTTPTRMEIFEPPDHTQGNNFLPNVLENDNDIDDLGEPPSPPPGPHKVSTAVQST